MSNKREMVRSNTYRPDIDGLRALAVVAVIVGHYAARLLPCGFLGVDLFFVISGFVITASLTNRPDQPWGQYLLEFYSRRIKRLVPALAACILVTSILSSIFIVIPSSSFGTGALALFGMSNIYLFRESMDYFGQSIKLNLFTHTWSLGVEEQFYMCFPVILGLSGLTRSKRPAGARNTLLAIGTLSSVSLGAFLYLASTNPEAAFYLMPARFWELGVGSLVYITSNPARPDFPRHRSTLTVACLTAIVGLTIIVCLPERLKTSATIAAVVLVAFIIRLLRPENRIVSDVLSNRAMVHLGLMSYSLYLWHWPLLAFTRNLVGLSSKWALLSFAGTLPIAAISYRCVEVPLRRATWSLKKSLTIVYGLSGSVAVAGLLILIAKGLNLGGRGRWSKVHEPIPSFLYTASCHLPTGPDPLDACLRPSDKASAGRVFLMGDSHAGNLLKGLELATKRKGMELRYLTDRALALHLIGSNSCGGTACEADEIEARIRFLRRYMRRGDVLILSFARDRMYPQEESLYWSADKLRKDSLGSAAALSTNLSRLIEPVQALGGRVLLVEDIPKVCTSDEFQIWTNGVANLCKVSREQSLLHRQVLADVYSKLAIGRSNVSVFDPHSSLCPSGECSNWLNGKVIYVDGSPHLTIEASESLADDLASYL